MTPPTAAVSRRPRKRRAAEAVAAPAPLQQDWSNLDPNDLSSPALYINRELSWLSFNERVLAQAQDASHPLLERVKFLAITGTNLDEFFMVRVATILKKFRAGIEDVSIDGQTTDQQLATIRSRALAQIDDQTACWSQSLRPLLAAEGIHFLEPADYTPAIDAWLAQYFKDHIFPVLTPLAFDPGHPFPYISNLSMNLAVRVRHSGRTKFARVKVPSMLPRFIALPDNLSPQAGVSHVFLEDVIRRNIQQLFPGTQVEGAHLFRIIRDTDMVIQEDEADDLLETVDRGLKQLRYGALSLLQVEADMPKRVLSILIENFEVDEDVVVRTTDRLGYGDWHALYKLHRPALKYPAFTPRTLWAPGRNRQGVRPDRRSGFPAPPSVRFVHLGRNVPARRRRGSARHHDQDHAVSHRRQLAAGRPADRGGRSAASRSRCWSSSRRASTSATTSRGRRGWKQPASTSSTA